LTLEPVAGEPEVGRWLAALADCRQETLSTLDGLTDADLHVRPPGSENSIATLLHHLALIEADWLVDDVFGIPLEESELAPWFPLADRDESGLLTVSSGESLAQLLDRLAAVREEAMRSLSGLSLEEFHAPRRRASYDVSPIWVVHHLLQHEAEHRSELAWVRTHADQ
jgi:hypothetical protein